MTNNKNRTKKMASPIQAGKLPMPAAAASAPPAATLTMHLRLSQVAPHKHCALVLSSFSEDYKAAFKEICALYHFDHCEVIDRNGDTQLIVSDTPNKTQRTLRIIHQFIPESDLIAVIHRASEGSLAGSGDTACMRGFLGKYPFFIPGSFIQARWEEPIEYFQEKGFPLLADWLQTLGPDEETTISKTLEELPPSVFTEKCHNPALLAEWKEFTSRIKQELEIGPWVQRLVTHCAFVSQRSPISNQIHDLQKRLFQPNEATNSISLQAYIPKCTQKLVFGVRQLGSKFSVFTRALCLHNGRSLQTQKFAPLPCQILRLLNSLRYKAEMLKVLNQF